MILSIGEILIDSFRDRTKATDSPGGAPFNIACNIVELGGNASFYGVVGNDRYGDRLRSFAEEKTSCSYVKSKAGHPTTIALVTLQNGERSFRFIRGNAADYQLEAEDIGSIPLDKVKIVHFGSLMLSEPEGRKFLEFAIPYFRKFRDIRLSFDVNYRDDIYASSDDARKYSIWALRQMDIVKISSDELPMLCGQEDVLSSLKKLMCPEQDVFLTLGKGGSMYWKNGKSINVPSVPVSPVDTTGAGDAFYSYVLLRLDEDMTLLNDPEKTRAMLRNANIAGALSTLKKGATGTIPSLKEINDFGQ